LSLLIFESLLYAKPRRLKEAQKLLAEAKVLFAGCKQEVQLLVASSELAVERNDYDSAVRMLDKIDVESPTYSRALLIKVLYPLICSANFHSYLF
jgi:predicted Zn-dependent protease